MRVLTRQMWWRARQLKRELEQARLSLSPGKGTWYRYDTLGNLKQLWRLLGSRFDLGALVGDAPIADIGTGDGDLAFLLESFGFEVHAFDNPPTNINWMTGIRALKQHRGSGVSVFELDIDNAASIPTGRQYGLAVVLGILYHLKNPYGVLELIREHAKHCLLSTRIAQCTPDGATRIDAHPLAYLLAPSECNDDATNFWIFSFGGLERLVSRTGWRIVKSRRCGATAGSDPVRRDERAFLLLERA